LDLSPGEECDYCGTVAYATMVEPPPRPKRTIVRYFYQSSVDYGKNEEGVWKPCSTENSCLLMARNGFKVKKIVKDV